MERSFKASCGIQIQLKVSSSSDNKYLLVGSNDKTASLWTVSNWTSIHTFRHLSPVDAVSFTPDNKMVITASWGDKDQGSNLLFWDISNFTLKQKITGFLASTYPSTPTWAIDISQDNLHLASVSEDNFARIWKFCRWKSCRSNTGQKYPVNCILT